MTTKERDQQATEGQAKIRELLERALDQAPQCTCSEAYKSRGMAAPDCAGCDAFEMIQLVKDALAELEAPSTPSSPPIVGEPVVTAPKHLNLEDEARVWYGDNYDYVTASNQHAIRMLAAFASHVLSLSPSAQGVTVDDDWIDEVAHKWAVSQWTDREDMQDQRMTEFGHAVRILRFALLTK